MVNHRKALIVLPLSALVWLLVAQAVAWAQEKDEPKQKADSEQFKPVEIKERPGGEPSTDEMDAMVGALLEEELNKEIMVEALKTKTRTEEVPAIITLVSSQKIQDLGFRHTKDAIITVPGFWPYNYFYRKGISAAPRGLTAGSMILRDGIDHYDAVIGTLDMKEMIPIETIRRIEFVAGPGGVLWGANSFFGIVNLVSKTADDLDGVEGGIGLGHGRGRPQNYKGYAMAGQKFFGERLKIFMHTSYESWHEPETHFPFNTGIAVSGTPQPQAPTLMTGPVTSDALRSWAVIFDGNIQYGPWSLYWSIPEARNYQVANWNGVPSQADLPEDDLDCSDPANSVACAQRVGDLGYARQMNNYSFERYAMMRFKDAFWDNKWHVTSQAYYLWVYRGWRENPILFPSSYFKQGFATVSDYSQHRVGGSVDNTFYFGWGRALIGGEVMYDYMPEHISDFRVDPSLVDQLPVECPDSPDEGTCPIVNMFQTDRLTGGLFVSAATRIFNDISLDAGSRLQVYGGKRAVDPELLFTGGAAWTFLPRWNLKVNFLQGFRTPSMQKTDGNGEAINWQGNPDLEAEKSQSLQGEINTMLAIGHKTVKVLKVRADYSYSWVSNFIELDNGVQRNLSDIGIHAVELLADLQMKNAHWFSLGYTFLDLSDAVRGKIRTVPAQWLNLGAFVNLWNKQLYLSSNLTIVGSMQDPNRYTAREAGTVRIGGLDDAGQPLEVQAYEAQATDIIVDRLPPAAIWNAGIRYLMPKYKLRFSFDAYNLLDTDYYEGEAMMDLSTFMQMVPLAGEGFSFFFRCQANL